MPQESKQITVNGTDYHIGSFTPQVGSQIYFKLLGALAATNGDFLQISKHVTNDDFAYIQHECMTIVQRARAADPNALTPIYNKATKKFAFADLESDCGMTAFKLTLQVLKERLSPFFQDAELNSQIQPEAE